MPCLRLRATWQAALPPITGGLLRLGLWQVRCGGGTQKDIVVLVQLATVMTAAAEGGREQQQQQLCQLYKTKARHSTRGISKQRVG